MKAQLALSWHLLLLELRGKYSVGDSLWKGPSYQRKRIKPGQKVLLPRQSKTEAANGKERLPKPEHHKRASDH